MNLARETMNEPDAAVNEPVVFDAELRDQLNAAEMRMKMAEFAADLNRYTVRDQAHEIQKMRFRLYEMQTAVAKAEAVAEHERRLTRQMRAAFEHERAEGFVSGAMTVCELLAFVATNLDDNGEFLVMGTNGTLINLAAKWPSDAEDTAEIIGVLMSAAAEDEPKMVPLCRKCEQPLDTCEPCSRCADCAVKPAKLCVECTETAVRA